MTFELCKQLPLHGWFYYKEGFSPEIIRWALQREGKAERIVDPFCGVGTTLLAAKQAGLQSRGIDASELAVFVSKTKTQDYGAKDLEDALEFVSRVFSERKEESVTKWEFELFDVRAAFPKRNLNDILFLRRQIECQSTGFGTLGTKPRTQDLLLLALLSVLPQCSLAIKDGGVLKIDRHKSAMPVKDAFKRKVKKIVNELKYNTTNNTISGPESEVHLGDARDTGFDGESGQLIVTSPPYLNNIDYAKVYGLELSLLAMSRAAAEETRARSVRSFIGTKINVNTMPPEIGGIGEHIPVIRTYFADMEQAVKEMFRVLAPGGAAYIVVSNSVIHETHVLVDEIFAEMAERIGFSDAEIIIGAERIADVRPAKVKTRESVVVLKK